MPQPMRLPPDAATRRVLDMVSESGVPPMHEQGVDGARESMRAGTVNDLAPPEVAAVEALSIASAAATIATRIYRPRTAAPGELGLTLFFHGGGYVIGDLDTHDSICRTLSLLSDSVVMAVDYRRAPEHRYPAAVEDALAALEYAVTEAEALAIDPARLAVAGDSAGGALAAVLAHEARDRDLRLRAQLLLYPVVDMLGEYASGLDYADMHPIPAPVQDWFWTHYFGAEGYRDTALLSEPWASPLRGPRFDDLAPAFVLTAGLDPLRDQGLAYAERLAAAGVETVYHCVMGSIHGVLRLRALIPAANDAMQAAASFLARHMASGERAQTPP